MNDLNLFLSINNHASPCCSSLHNSRQKVLYFFCHIVIDKLNDGYEDCSPGPVYNTTGMGIKTRAVSFTTGKGSRTNINEGVLNNPSPTHYENTLK